ncbi:hypothetical protein [Pseudomonas sp. S3_E11]
MNEQIIFIDDEKSSRTLYRAILQDIYGDEYTVMAIEPKPTIAEMIKALEKIDSKVSIIIDEKLNVEIGTDYTGSQLVKAIRTLDSKLPLYILTSEMGLVESPFGSIEYTIDKNIIQVEEHKKQFAIMMRRHINSFNEIKSARSQRFEQLLKKSIKEELSKEELVEYEELDFLRVREVLSTENVVSSAELDRQEDLIKEISAKLEQLGRK